MNIVPQHGLGRRVYRSELRAAHATSTRQRILEAVSTLVKTNDGRLSIASIARTAGVSLPTVHRHFPTKRELFEAYRLTVERALTGTAKPAALPTTMAGMAPTVRAFFRRFGDPDDPIGHTKRLHNAMEWELSREVTVPRRMAWIDHVMTTQFPGLSRADRERMSDLFVVVVSASMAEALRGYLNRSPDEMADRAIWALNALSAYATQRSKKKGRR